MVGIISYGTYVPKYRIKTADIASVWGKNGQDIASSLGVIQKSVPGIDEDAVTIALEAATNCLEAQSINPSSLEVLFVGSESRPYAVNPTSTIVGELLGVGNNYLASDFEFACKAGTSAMQALAGLIQSGHVHLGMAIGTDAAQGKPHDALEYTSASAGVSFLLGGNEDDIIAKLLSFTSYSSDTPDFWRRDGIRYPSHAGRFTGEPAYFAHVEGATHRLLEMTQCKHSDIDYCVFHMPNGKFPRQAAKRLGFTHKQLLPSLTIDSIGNPYSASSLLGFAAVLDIASPGDKVLMVSYGSGAGSDAFLWEVTENIEDIKETRNTHKTTVISQLSQPTYISYVEYLKHTRSI